MKVIGKSKYAKIRPVGLNPVVVYIEDVKEYLENSEVGDKWEIEIVEMTDGEYESLPEFKGF